MRDTLGPPRDLIETYLAYTQHNEACTRYHLWTALTLISAAIGRKMWLDRATIRTYPNIYTVLVGRAGLAHKTTATSTGVNLLKQAVPKLPMATDRFTPQGLIESMASANVPFAVSGERFENSTVFVHAPELAVAFKGASREPMLDLLTHFYDCPGDGKTDWVDSSKLGDTRIKAPGIVLLADSTQAWLNEVFRERQVYGGTASRVFFIGENQNERSIAWPEDVEDETLKSSLIAGLSKIYQTVGQFRVSEEVKKRFISWHAKHQAQSVMNNDPRLHGYMGRKSTHVLKIAMLKCVARFGFPDISIEDLKWAVTALDEMERSFFDVVDQMAENHAKIDSKTRELYAARKMRLGPDFDTARQKIITHLRHYGKCRTRDVKYFARGSGIFATNPTHFDWVLKIMAVEGEIEQLPGSTHWIRLTAPLRGIDRD